MELEFEVLVFRDMGKPENLEKNPWSNNNNNKANPLMTLSSGFKPRSHWWGESALAIAPLLLFRK